MSINFNKKDFDRLYNRSSQQFDYYFAHNPPHGKSRVKSKKYELEIGIGEAVERSRKLEGIEEKNAIICRVCHDSFKYLHQQNAKHAKIVIDSVENGELDAEQQGDKIIHYKLLIKGEVRECTAELRYAAEEQKYAVEVREDQEHLALTRSNNQRALLERFSSCDQSEQGVFGAIKRASGHLFAQLIKPFELLSSLWQELTGRSQKEMHYDLSLLSDVSGQPIPEKLTITQSLKYMLKLLKREKTELAHPQLEKRLSLCYRRAKKIERLRKSYKKEEFNSLVKSIQRDIDKLTPSDGEKILIPIGFHHRGKFIEMFLEVQKTADDTCTASIISHSQETLDLFDREAGVETTSKALRREIANIHVNDLKSRIPQLMELQTNPAIHKQKKLTNRDPFLQALQFNGSEISVGKMTETFVSKKQDVFGNVSEIMSYVKSELLDSTKSKEDADRFEVAARLRFLLDFCKRDKLWLKDQKARELVKTTIFQLMETIENNRKELIGDKEFDQGKEMTQIFHELDQILQLFDDILPDTPNLNKLKMAEAELGSVSITAKPETPDLENMPLDAVQEIEVGTPFDKIDENDPVESLNQFAKRCRELLESGENQKAGYEAHLIVRDLASKYEQVKTRLIDQSEGVLGSFEQIGQAIARGVLEKSEPSFDDALAASALNLFAFDIAKDAGLAEDQILSPFAYKAHENIVALKNSRISVQDKILAESLKSIVGTCDEENIRGLNGNQGNQNEIFQKLMNLCAFTYLASEDVKEADREILKEVGALSFTSMKMTNEGGEVKKIELTGPEETDWKPDLLKFSSTLSSKVPEYAQSVAEEIGGQYTLVSNPNPGEYGLDAIHQRYCSPYSLFHFIERYCPNLFKEGMLELDEMSDLMLLQQTNQKTDDLFYEHDERNRMRTEEWQNQQGGYSFPEKPFTVVDDFNSDDRRIQVMNSLKIFLQHPNFFKIPSLRWFLETKLLTGSYFNYLLDPENIEEHLPFLLNTLQQLNDEVRVAAELNRDMETAGYLVHLLDQLKEMIRNYEPSEGRIEEFAKQNIRVWDRLTDDKKQEFYGGISEILEDSKGQLIAKIQSSPEDLIKWMRELTAQTDDLAKQGQKDLMPYVIHYYLDRYRQDFSVSESTFDDHDLQNIAYALGRYEALYSPDDPIDPELKESCQELKIHAHRLLKNHMEAKSDEEREQFVNGAVKMIDAKFSDYTWKAAQFPLFEAADQNTQTTYQFNLMTGEIYLGGERAEKIPRDIQSNDEIRRLYGGRLNEVWQVKGAAEANENHAVKITSYSHPEFPDQRIVIRREIKGEGNPTGEKPEVIIERKAVGGDQSKWVFYHRFEAQDQLAKGGELTAADLPPKVAAAIGDRSCWIDRESTRIYVWDQDEKEPFATIVLGERAGDGSIPEELKEQGVGEEVESLPFSMKEVQFSGKDCLLSPEEGDLLQYTTIEDEDFVTVIGSKGRAAKLEYPRLELASSGALLSYHLTKEGAASPLFEGFVLAPLGSRPGERKPADGVFPLPETFDQFQILRKDEEEKILIASREFSRQFSRAGGQLSKLKMIAPENFQKSAVYEYAVNPETNRLAAASGDAYAYLAYVSLAHRDYAGAKYYLDRAKTSVGYTQEYDKIFEWIQQWPDRTGSGLVVKLHAALFQEKVFEDRKMRQIRQGKGGDLEAHEQRMERLETMGNLYHQYRLSVDQRKIGLSGIDPILDLSIHAEKKALELIHELIRGAGNRELREEPQAPPEFKRAEAGDVNRILAEPTEEKILGNNYDVFRIWAYGKSGTKIPEITYGKPEWVLDNFGYVFDQLLLGDKDTVEFKELVQKIRFPSHNPPREHISDEKNAAIGVAQAYLLRLIELKENESDLDEISQFPKLEDPLLGRSREERCERFFKIPEEVRNSENQNDLETAIKSRLSEIDNELRFRSPSRGDLLIEKSLLKKIETFCKNFVDDSVGNPDQFAAFYEDFLKRMMIEWDDGQMIFGINQVFNKLRNVPLTSLEQQLEDREDTQGELPFAESLTIAQKYSNLLDEPPEHLRGVVDAFVQGDAEMAELAGLQTIKIDQLEEEIESRDEPVQMEKIETPETGIHYVLGDERVEEVYKTYRNKPKSVEAAEIDEAVFNSLIQSEEGAVRRLAEEHRQDMRTYQKESQQVDITRRQAIALRKHLVAQREDLSENKSKIRKDLLQTVERFQAPAGILAIRRKLGSSKKPDLDYLIHLWRHGQLTLPWGEDHPLKKLGETVFTDSELLDLDARITEYLDTATTLRHMDQVIHSAELYIRSCKKGNRTRGDQQLAQSLARRLETKRHYSYFVSDRDTVTMEDLANAIHEPEIRKLLIIKIRGSKIRGEKDNKLEGLLRDELYFRNKTVVLEYFTDPLNKPLLEKILKENKDLHTLVASVGNDSDYREMLFMEHTLGIILRESQVDTIRGMLHNPNAVMQLQMGGGKSKVLLPLLAQKKATGKNLVMLMLPEALYETNCRDLDAANRELFGQEIFRFDFDRHSDRSVEALRDTYIHLLETVRDKGFATTTKSSMLSFRNAYFELLHELSKIPEEQRGLQYEIVEQLKVMSKILKLFKDNTDVLSDEVDACLDVRKEVNFALGEPQKVNSIIRQVGADLLGKILEAEEGTGLQALKTALLNNTQASIPPADLKLMMADLAKVYFSDLSLENVDEDAFIQYMMDELEGELPHFMEGLRENDDHLYRQIAAAKAFLHRGFGQTLGKIGGVNYGRGPKSIWTIPYKASNTPSEGSEFDDTIERISFTLQDYIQNGASFEQVWSVVNTLREHAKEEQRLSDEVIPLNETIAATRFKSYIESMGIQGVSLAALESEEKVVQLNAELNSTPERRLAFARKYILPQMTQAPIQVNSVSGDAADMVRGFGGFTGTPWNKHAYPDKVTTEKSSGTDGRTWALLLERNVAVKTFTLDSCDPAGSLLDGADIVGNYQAVIDAGAYLRGTTEEQYIKAYLKKCEENGVEGSSGVYFDKTGRIVKKVGFDGRPLPIERSAETDLMKTHTLYDQAHTVGADIGQAKGAKALVTVGEGTFIRDLFQAVWRLRQLDEQQNVEIIVSEDVKKLILKDDENPDRDLDIRDVLAFCLKNESKRESEDNFRAELGKIRGTPSQEILRGFTDWIADEAADPGEIVKAAYALGNWFTKKRPEDEMFNEFAKVNSPVEPAAVLDEAKISTVKRLNMMQNALEQAGVENHSEMFNFVEAAQSIEKRKNPSSDWMPNLVDRAIAEGGQEVEIEAIAETQVEQIAETEVSAQTDTQQTTRVGGARERSLQGSDLPIASLSKDQIDDFINRGKTPIYTEITGTMENIIRTPHDMLRPLSHSIEVFDPSIYVSAGVEQQLLPLDAAAKDFNEVAEAVFYNTRNKVKDILIVKHKDQWKMIIPTIHESQAACREYCKTVNAETTQAACVFIGSKKPIVNFKTGDPNEELPFEGDDRDMFYRLYVQAKFFNGEIDFGSKEEKEALKAWLSEKGPERCCNLFEMYILPTIPERFQERYETSTLKQIFTGLLED